MALPPGPRAPAALNTARFMRRPLETLLAWRDRYGDVFAVRFLVFGQGVYVADPEAIRELFTGDQSDLHAGEANAPLAGVLGEHSVLVLDGPEHMRQRRLLLPPFKGSAVSGFRPMIRELAEAEVDRWAVGAEFAIRERMRALTFGVICRAVFGVYEPERVERLRAAMLALIDTQDFFFAPDLLLRDLGRFSPGGLLAGADAGRGRPALRGDRPPPARGGPRGAHGRPLAAAARPRRGRAGDDGRRAARRADDDARRRPRDHRDRARLRLRPAAPQPAASWNGCATSSTATTTPISMPSSTRRCDCAR